tara:strand:- start:3231 stop:8240 length:5010 start_codon:yes stop_codon:yes gene_type:complete
MSDPNTDMSPADRERLEQLLLEHAYGCAENPEAVETLLASDAQVRALQAKVLESKGLLDAAGQGSAPEVHFAPPTGTSTEARIHALRSPRWFTHLGRAAALLLVTFGLALPWAGARLARGRADDSTREVCHLVLSGPAGLPDGAPGRIHVETWDADGDALPAKLTWRTLDDAGNERASGALDSEGSVDLEVPRELTASGGHQRFEVLATPIDSESEAVLCSLDIAPDRETPLVHLISDKPIYRPGELVYLRAVLLDRLSLEAKTGWYQLRIVDPKGAPIDTWSQPLESGVASTTWMIPKDAAGGEYVFELRDRDDAFVVDALPLLVQRFQPPQLVKDVQLDRETYAPGDSGSAELTVTRTTGGPAVDANILARVLLDGEEVWTGQATLDADGKAIFTFDVPEHVVRGEATFLARIVDGGVVETAVEPFRVPTGALHATFHAEGGDLIAGVPCRVYVEVTDELERPADASGRIVDADGTTLTTFTTSHQGRGLFELTPTAGATYALVFDEAFAAPEVALPPVRAEGVVLRVACEDRASGPLDVQVHTTDVGPWIVAAFSRGVLVSQDTFRGEGQHDITLDPDAAYAGVLRVTVFDHELKPVAERLVHRKSGRAVLVSIEPLERELLPGAHQRLELRTTDETGAPVDAVLGIVVSDHALTDLALHDPIGLADATWLASDVEDFEDMGEFFGDGPEVAERVDLLLGTRGWRRFGWVQPDTLIAEHGDAGKRLMIREGRSMTPRVSETYSGREEMRLAVRLARTEEHEARDATGFAFVGFLWLGLIWALGLVRAWKPRVFVRMTTATAALAAIVIAMLSVPGARNAAGIELAADAMAPRANRMPMVEDAMVGGEAEWGFDVALDAQQDGIPAFRQFDAGGIEVEHLLEAKGGEDFFLGAGPGAGPPVLVARAGAVGGAAVDFLDDYEGLEDGEPAADDAFPGLAGLAPMGYAGDDDDGPAGRFDPSNSWGRIYAHRNRPSDKSVRSDFTETVYWNGIVPTGPDGTARVEFDLSDRVTTWDVRVDAHGAGRVGQALLGFEAVPPFAMEAKLPVELTAGDRVQLPVSLIAADPNQALARVAAEVRGPVQILGDLPESVELESGRGRVLVPITANADVGTATLGLMGEVNGWTDRVLQTIPVVPRGFPHHVAKSGLVTTTTEFVIGVPEDHVPGSLSSGLTFYPAPLTDLVQGLEGILQMPYGCFEQASATNYPNVLAVAYMEAAGIAAPSVMAKARTMMASGYDRLVGYETSEDGYEWFGGAPAHEALTAYGLVQFVDMAQVFDVDASMLERTRQYLMGRRTGKGGYERNDKALDRFGSAPQPVTDAYVTYALAVAGTPPRDIEGELDRLEERGLESDDPYEVALAAGALHAAERTQAANAVRDRLKTMQEDDGRLEGTTSSITSSQGDDLIVETTALALLAWLDDAEDEANAHRALQYLVTMRRDGGRFGSTQATVQALRAMTGWARTHRRIANAGEVVVYVNDFEVERQSFDSGRKGALHLNGVAEHLAPGENRVRLELTGGNEFPWSFDMAYFSEVPADDPSAPIELRTTLAAESVVEGDGIGLDIVVQNLTPDGLPMALAVIGLPAGLDCPNGLLEERQADGVFDLWERRGRELVFYWRDFEPSQRVDIHLDLIARIPGTTTGPASRIYPYYAPDQVRWAEPLAIEVTPAR